MATPSTTITATTSSTPIVRKNPIPTPPVLSVRPISRCSRFQSLKAKATENDQAPKKTQKANSIVCTQCEGNGAIQCTQCKGTGVNSVDHFNGRFKAGGLCWLCRGKREILCGNCNGAGFLGGFLSTFDETAD